MVTSRSVDFFVVVVSEIIVVVVEQAAPLVAFAAILSIGHRSSHSLTRCSAVSSWPSSQRNRSVRPDPSSSSLSYGLSSSFSEHGHESPSLSPAPSPAFDDMVQFSVRGQSNNLTENTHAGVQG